MGLQTVGHGWVTFISFHFSCVLYSRSIHSSNKMKIGESSIDIIQSETDWVNNIGERFFVSSTLFFHIRYKKSTLMSNKLQVSCQCKMIGSSYMKESAEKETKFRISKKQSPARLCMSALWQWMGMEMLGIYSGQQACIITSYYNYLFTSYGSAQRSFCWLTVILSSSLYQHLHSSWPTKDTTNTWKWRSNQWSLFSSFARKGQISVYMLTELSLLIMPVSIQS